MKKTIKKKLYNTETAVLVGTYYFSYFGDPEGYEENLYQTRSGLYFLYGVGGEASKYPTADIVALSKAEADAWIAENL